MVVYEELFRRSTGVGATGVIGSEETVSKDEFKTSRNNEELDSWKGKPYRRRHCRIVRSLLFFYGTLSPGFFESYLFIYYMNIFGDYNVLLTASSGYHKLHSHRFVQLLPVMEKEKRNLS